jgi:hypothetical protein
MEEISQESIAFMLWSHVVPLIQIFKTTLLISVESHKKQAYSLERGKKEVVAET